MKQGKLYYPKIMWLLLLALNVMAFVPYVCVFAVVLSALASLLFVSARNAYLHPLGLKNLAYLQWLKTTPFHSRMELPNGSVFPGLQDAAVVLLLCAPGYIVINDLLRDPLAALLYSGIQVNGILALFALVTARQLFITGPFAIAYTLLFLLLAGGGLVWHLVLQGDFAPNFFDNNNGFIPGVVWMVWSLPAFALAVLGLRIMMKQYPWDYLTEKDWRIRRLIITSVRELIPNQADHLELGEPFTALRPDAIRQPVSWVHVVGVTSLAMLSVIVFSGSTGYFCFLAGAVIVARVVAYFGSSRQAVLRNPITAAAEYLTRRRTSANAVTAVFVLIFLAGFFVYVLQYSSVQIITYPTRIPPGPPSWLTAIFTGIVYLAAFKLPPSLKYWETTGIWRIQVAASGRRQAAK